VRIGRPATVRARVTALASVAVLGVLVLAGVLLVAQQRRVLTEALDESLLERADDLVGLGDAAPSTITALGDDDTVAQVLVDGRVVARSPRLAGKGPLVDERVDAGATTVEGLPHEAGRFRLVSRVGDDGRLVVHVAGPLDDIDDGVATLGRSLVTVVPVVAVAVAVLVWWLVGRTLRPVEAIRAEVARIGAISGPTAGRRVPVPAGDDEVARLARTMNEMLERVDAAARRQQRFLADASHELRSPLARMRTELEVDLAHPSTADPLATHRSILDEAVGLQQLADDLLLLARLDGDGSRSPDQVVDLGLLTGRVLGRLAVDDRVRVDLSAADAVVVNGNPTDLGRAIGNLVENARRHARTTVDIDVARRDGAAVLTVRDDGPGVPEEERERIFERFARVDAARTAGGGAGLGLAIARDVAQRHGGTLGLASSAPGGAAFVLTLPLASSGLSGSGGGAP